MERSHIRKASSCVLNWTKYFSYWPRTTLWVDFFSISTYITFNAALLIKSGRNFLMKWLDWFRKYFRLLWINLPQSAQRNKSSPKRSVRLARNTWCQPNFPGWLPVRKEEANYDSIRIKGKTMNEEQGIESCVMRDK